MNLGFHATISGGLHNAPLEAAKYSCGCFQIFSKNPRGWSSSVLTPEGVDLFKKEVRKSGFFPVVVHTSYLLNLASANEDLYRKSISAFAEEIKRAELIGAEYITTHIGSCGDCNREEALQRILTGIKSAEKLSGTAKINILFENSSHLKAPGSVLSELAYLVKQCGSRFGITLDTCHAFAAGYDLRDPKMLATCLKEAGQENIKVIHLNDSKGVCGSGLDRHEYLGKGFLGRRGLSNVVNHPAFKHLPLIMETPYGKDGTHKKDIAFARKCSSSS